MEEGKRLKSRLFRDMGVGAFSERLFALGTSAFGRATGLNGFSPACETYMYEDLSEIYQAALEDERKRKYMKEIGDWLVEEYFEPYQAS